MSFNGSPETATMSAYFPTVSEPIETIEMVGLVYEASKVYELVFARHLSHVAASGKLEVGI